MLAMINIKNAPAAPAAISFAPKYNASNIVHMYMKNSKKLTMTIVFVRIIEFESLHLPNRLKIKNSTEAAANGKYMMLKSGSYSPYVI
jgi:hypothetical protein